MKIAAGAAHFLALKKVYRQPFKEWTPEMVEKWVSEVGFDGITKVIRFSKIIWAPQNTLGIAGFAVKPI